LPLNAEIRHFRFSREDVDLNYMTRIVSIDHAHSDSITAYANDREWKAFLQTGTAYRILLSDKMPKGLEMTSEDLRDIGWSKYPTYKSYLNMMASFVKDYPALCRIDTIGYSVQGRLLLAAHVSADIENNTTKPTFFYTAQMHGDETAGMVLMLRLIDSLLTGYSHSQKIYNLLNTTQMWINPLANPDGTYFASDSSLEGSIRHNANEEDLNRNFPDPPHVSEPNTRIRQPETLAMMVFAEKHAFRMSANFHGGNECVNFPWDSSPDCHPETRWFKKISHEYADTVRYYSPDGYFSGFDRGVTNGWDWYSIYGGRQDYMNFYHNCKEITIELSHVKQLPADQLKAHWDYNKRSLLNIINNMGQGLSAIWSVGDEIPLFVEIVTIPGLKIPIKKSSPAFHYPLTEGLYTVCFHYKDYTDTLKHVTVHKNQLTDLNREATPVAEKSDIPDPFILDPAYPNPFNPRTRFTLRCPSAGIVEIAVYDIRGSLVRILYSGFLESGEHLFVWEGNNQTGKEVSSGIYIIHVHTKREAVRQKAVLIR
jgi:hypothetical protein